MIYYRKNIKTTTDVHGSAYLIKTSEEFLQIS